MLNLTFACAMFDYFFMDGYGWVRIRMARPTAFSEPHAKGQA